MPIVIGAVSGHGIRTIPLLSETADNAMGTRQALLELSRRFTAAKLDVLIVATPHGIRVEDCISISDAGRGAGTAHWKGRTVELNVPMDLELSRKIAARAREMGIPVALVGYGGSNAPSSVLPLDWGVIIPTWFAGYQVNQVGQGHVMGERSSPDGPLLVVVNPSRTIPREQNIEFGQAVAEVASHDERRIGFIASCDWAHKHSADSRFGFHPDAKPTDERVVQAIKADDIPSLLDITDETAENAAIDGLWQLLMLEGVKRVTPMTVDFLSYEVADYFGMIVATYEPVEGATV